MKYITREGQVINHNDGQDKLLKLLYTTVPGRVVVKLLVNQKVSIIGGRLLSTKVSSLLIRPFVKKNNIDMSLYESKKYDSYNDFFTRKIKKNFRKIEQDKKLLISPCDAKLSVYKIDDNMNFNIKNTSYTLEALLKDKNLAKHFNNGYCLVFRLTVDDYHRYINIDDGKVVYSKKIKGIFHTVNPIANDIYPIYKENSREYIYVKGDNVKDYVQMEVGALMVGKISNKPVINNRIKKGSEKGFFEFGGSTIVLLLKDNQVIIDNDLLDNTLNNYETIVKMGEKLGSISI